MAQKRKTTGRGCNTKFWRFTCNNYTAQCLDAFQKVRDNVEYLVFGKEVGSQGTPHLQGYLVFKKKQYLSACRKISGRTDFEPVNGTPSQNDRYCRKGEQSKEEWEQFKELGPHYGKNADVFSYGVLPKDPKERAKDGGLKGSAKGGKATAEKWENIWSLAKESNFEAIPPKIRVTHWRTLNAIAQDYQQDAQHLEDVCGIWLHGPPNSGKSHYARHYCGDGDVSDVTVKTTNYEKLLNKWWDGYNDRKSPYVFIEEIDESHAPFMGAYLKRWADKWSFTAEHKGTTRCHRPKAVLVTSNYTISEVFSKQGSMMIEAVARRFKVIRFYGNDSDELTGARNESPENRGKTWFCRFLPMETIDIVPTDGGDLHQSSHEARSDSESVDEDEWDCLEDSVDHIKRRKKEVQEVDTSAEQLTQETSDLEASEEEASGETLGSSDSYTDDNYEGVQLGDMSAEFAEVADDLEAMEEIRELLNLSTADI